MWTGNRTASDLLESVIEDEEKSDRRTTEPEPDRVLSTLSVMSTMMRIS